MVAVTVFAVPIVNVQLDRVPVQSPPQPASSSSPTSWAESVTWVPCRNSTICSLQELSQLTPAGSDVMVPCALPAFLTVSLTPFRPHLLSGSATIGRLRSNALSSSICRLPLPLPSTQPVSMIVCAKNEVRPRVPTGSSTVIKLSVSFPENCWVLLSPSTETVNETVLVSGGKLLSSTVTNGPAVLPHDPSVSSVKRPQTRSQVARCCRC